MSSLLQCYTPRIGINSLKWKNGWFSRKKGLWADEAINTCFHYTLWKRRLSYYKEVILIHNTPVIKIALLFQFNNTFLWSSSKSFSPTFFFFCLSIETIFIETNWIILLEYNVCWGNHLFSLPLGLFKFMNLFLWFIWISLIVLGTYLHIFSKKVVSH